MRRPVRALAAALLLAAMLPGSVAGDKVTKYDDHTVDAGCDAELDGGFATGFASSSDGFGEFAEVSVWLPPAIPFEDGASISGYTDAVDVVEGPQVAVSASMPLTDASGNDLGVGTLTMNLAPVGDPEPFTEPGFGNHRSRTEGTRQFLEGSGSFTMEGLAIDFAACFGTITDISVFFTNPHSFVSRTTGLELSCAWESEESFASFFAFTSGPDAFADAFLATPDIELFSTGQWTGTLDSTGVDVSMELTDPDGNPYSAQAAATFDPVGTPVTSTLRDTNGRTKVTQQLLTTAGELVFSTGASFPIDDEHCFADEFDQHVASNVSVGPKARARVPVNDKPDGAITLKPSGKRLVTNNRGASVDAEVPITACPEGPFDDFGRTLWYKIAGTGKGITVDTAGSVVDTVIGVYVKDGAEYVEIGCIDDVFYDPIGTSYQAALTFETERGVTYFVQIGGYREQIFRDLPPQIGQIKIAVR